ncbi:MAG: methyltransferase domain-containing protein [Candidatus Nanopelagicales bacterium]|nr:methyltransferase domain-containing protein [Candidatus Nanopelagicales bacterium]
MPATDQEIDAAWGDRKLANIVYHDWEAETYDSKWSISYDQRCVDYARNCFDHVHPVREQVSYDTVVELGSGTGFFLLNLMQSGIGRRGIATDLSKGMVSVAVRNGQDLGLPVDGVVADGESLPFATASVDLVVGHAVLHHIPDLDAMFSEVLRILKPGGRFVFCGEPTERGDLVARTLSRFTWWASTRISALPPLANTWAKSPEELSESSREQALESIVDIHTFDPDSLARIALRAGAINVSTVTEELSASWFGWPVRTFEAAVKPGALGWGWANFAFGTWKRLERLDKKVLSRIVPDEFFYNVCITGVSP